MLTPTAVELLLQLLGLALAEKEVAKDALGCGFPLRQGLVCVTSPRAILVFRGNDN